MNLDEQIKILTEANEFMHEATEQITKLKQEKEKLIIALGMALSGFTDSVPGPSSDNVLETISGKDPGDLREKVYEKVIKERLGRDESFG